nr:glycosyltransferase [uncultured Fusobacterium sp.]
MKKIALFFPVTGIGGAERRLSRIFIEIEKEKNIEVFWIILSKQSKEEIEKKYISLLEKNIKIIVFKNYFEVVRHFIKIKYNIVFYTDCCYRTIPIIYTCLFTKKKTCMLNVTSDIKLLNKISYIHNVVLSSQLDCLYPTNYKLLKRKFPQKQIVLTPGSFTDTAKFYPEIKKENLIIFSGRLIKEKGILLFLEAIVALREKIILNNYKVVILGNGNLKEQVEKIIIENKLEDFTSLHYTLNVEKILRKGKIFCSLMPDGNYPSQSLIEALSCGLFSIVTNTGDSHLMVKKPFGILIEQDKNELVKALEKGMSFTKEEFKEIEVESVKFIKENFTIKNSIEHYKKIIKEL